MGGGTLSHLRMDSDGTTASALVGSHVSGIAGAGNLPEGPNSGTVPPLGSKGVSPMLPGRSPLGGAASAAAGGGLFGGAAGGGGGSGVNLGMIGGMNSLSSRVLGSNSQSLIAAPHAGGQVGMKRRATDRPPVTSAAGFASLMGGGGGGGLPPDSLALPGAGSSTGLRRASLDSPGTASSAAGGGDSCPPAAGGGGGGG